MGLTISHQIVVEKHSGQFNCYSPQQQGAEFVIGLTVSIVISVKVPTKYDESYTR